MRRIGLQLIAEKKAAILAESREKGKAVERKDLQERDLLTLLIRANMATDIPESQRLTDDEVLARECPFSPLATSRILTDASACRYGRRTLSSSE